MSSTSLTPLPSTTSPFRLVEVEYHRRQYQHLQHLQHALSDTFLAPMAGLSNSTYPSRSSKRVRDVSSAPVSPKKRVRGGTPFEDDVPALSAEQSEVGQNASAAVHTTIAGPSSYMVTGDDGTATNGMGTSEAEDGTVLFSEQVRAEEVQQHSFNAAGTATPGGDLGDYLPQPEQVFSPKTQAQNGDEQEGGDELLDGRQEEEGQGDDNVGLDDDEENGQAEQAEEPAELEESQDQNDGDDDGAETPAWMTEPHVFRPDHLPLPPPPQPQPDIMTRVIALQAAQLRPGKNPDSPDSDYDVYEIAHGRPHLGSTGSYHSGDSDQYSMDYRPVLERTAVKHDIRKFVDNTLLLDVDYRDDPAYNVVDRLGEGTFSSVYLAHDIMHHYYNNEDWTYKVDTMSSRDIRNSSSRVKVALKKILATSSPARIENELHILESLRGCRNVSQLITAMREEDQVIIVLPYHRSDDFRHFYRHMDPPHIREYMRALFRALKDIHRRGIIHRDVKPANFLFDYEACQGVLCDFGLAERYQPPRKATCQHAPATLQALHGTRTKTADTAAAEQAVYDARKRAKLGEGRVGLNTDDKRPQIKTNRAGTRGFRAPEVLLKCPDQTVAIDVWSAGVILLSILTHKFPVFNSSDDIEALLEIAAIFGRPAMERCALLHNRTIISNIPIIDIAPPSLTTIVHRLNPNIYTPPLANPTPQEAKIHIQAIDQAIDLCKKLLRLDATQRLTASAALQHPLFDVSHLNDEDPAQNMIEEEDLLVNEGKCGNLHEMIMRGNKPTHVAYFGDDLVEMQFGQGIPTSRDIFCPEHEHWQTREGLNPLLNGPWFTEHDTKAWEAVLENQPALAENLRVLGQRNLNVER